VSIVRAWSSLSLDGPIAGPNDGPGNPVAGGGRVIPQCLRAGLLDDLRIDLVAIVLGGGVPLFEGADAQTMCLDVVEVSDARQVTHIRYRPLL
jgi:dihydrofolate reductase